jgi:hypothetical protein
MNRKPVIITVVLLVAIAGCVELKFLTDKASKPDSIQVSLSEEAPQNAGRKDNPIVVSQSEGLKYFYEGVSASEKDYQKVGTELLTVLDKIEKMSQCTITKNVNIKHDENGTEYYKVNDKSFGNLSDLKSYVKASVTESLLKERYAGMLDGESPVFREYDDGLYVKRRNDPAKGFEWEKNDDKSIKLAVIGKEDGKFKISATGYTIEIVDEGGIWKVNSITK